MSKAYVPQSIIVGAKFLPNPEHPFAWQRGAWKMPPPVRYVLHANKRGRRPESRYLRVPVYRGSQCGDARYMRAQARRFRRRKQAFIAVANTITSIRAVARRVSGAVREVRDGQSKD